MITISAKVVVKGSHTFEQHIRTSGEVTKEQVGQILTQIGAQFANVGVIDFNAKTGVAQHFLPEMIESLTYTVTESIIELTDKDVVGVHKVIEGEGKIAA